MPKVKFLKPFKYSPDGIQVVEYAADSSSQEVDQACADIACANGFAVADAKAAKKGESKAPGKAGVKADGDAGNAGDAQGEQAEQAGA